METTNRILLNSSLNKKSVNTNESININLSGNKKLLPEDAVSETIDSYNVYLDERSKSNKFRLIINLNPLCTNVLFNPFTEVVKNEGSDNVYCLNFAPKNERTTSYIKNTLIGSQTAVIGKTDNFEWTPYQATRDTQLSNKFCGFDYHCGFDIFNNHILRNKTFKAVNYSDKNSISSIATLGSVYGNAYRNVKVNERGNAHIYLDDNFNTIDDYMRDRNGVVISEHFSKFVLNGTERNNLSTFIMPLHLYQDYDIYSFFECYNEKLIEENGWFGFKNPAIISSMALRKDSLSREETTETFLASNDRVHGCEDSGYSFRLALTAVSTTDDVSYSAEAMSINKALNNRKYCEFIDMYPGRELYSFQPLFNPYRKRLEKNWNYCLTYPSKNLIRQSERGGEDFTFFRLDENDNVSLKVLMFDDYTVDDSGVAVLTVYCICRHGLMEGDYVNIYKGDDLYYDSVQVLHVIDNFIFQVKKDTADMSDKWVELEEDYTGATYPYEGKNYPVCASKRCNVDENAQDIHFRRVVNGVECKYYVREFSRLPNFKFKDCEINDYTLYEGAKKTPANKLDLIRRFSNPADEVCDFENHISKLGFAETSYGDDVAEIVYTDDIDTSYLRDNLGRPLSDIFLTIVKNNKGYKDWYGIGKGVQIKNNPDIEYSHCFGKVSCGFLFSEEYRYIINSTQKAKMKDLSFVKGALTPLKDVRDITAEDGEGLNNLNNVESDDEIMFNKDFNYYGDICCYSPVDCDEEVLQKVMNRFNTAQRELKAYGASSEKMFNSGELSYDEINEDDVENNLSFDRSDNGDPYDSYARGNLNHSTRVTTANEYLSYYEGYYHQAHYRIPVKTVSRSLSSDQAIKYVLYEINDTNKMSNNRKIFEFKTVDNNDFSRNDKIVMYKKSTNEYFFIVVYSSISTTTFYGFISDEYGNYLDEVDNLFGEENISNYVLLKKHPETPYYARLIKDGSCRYCWREIKSNGFEDEDKIYPFTNGAFYITKQINFFLRRQDPNKQNLGIHNKAYDFTRDGEYIEDYYDNIYTETYYESDEIEEC